MPFDEALAKRIRSILARRKGIVEKKMFGGVAFLLNGHLCVGVWKDSMIVRIDREETEETLREPHVGEFNITRRPMKGLVMVRPDGVASDDQLKDWIRRAVNFVGKMEAK